jgi:hypothetical protein
MKLRDNYFYELAQRTSHVDHTISYFADTNHFGDTLPEHDRLECDFCKSLYVGFYF